MARLKKLPKTIYVKIEHDGDDSFLLVGVTPEELAKQEDNVPVGEYVLNRRVTLVNRTEILD